MSLEPRTFCPPPRRRCLSVRRRGRAGRRGARPVPASPLVNVNESIGFAAGDCEHVRTCCPGAALPSHRERARSASYRAIGLTTTISPVWVVRGQGLVL